MNITLERDQLLNALGVVHRIVPKKADIPILQNVLLDAGPLTITANDCDMMGTAVLAGQAGTSSDRITVPGHTLYDIVRKFPAGATINAALEGPKGPLIVKSGRSRFSLQTLPAEDFPDFSIGEMSHHFFIPGATLAKLIGRCEFAICTEPTRFYLNGIYLHVVDGPDGPMLRLVATDGLRLAQVQTIAPPEAEGMPSVIVPRFFVSEMKRIAETAGDVEISLSKNKIRISNGKGTVLVSKLIDAQFPDYQRVIPSSHSRTAVIERACLETALDRLLTIAEGKQNAVKFAFKEDQLELTHTNPDRGFASEEIDASMTGDDFEIGFNGRFVLDVLGAAGGERIILKMGEPGAPGVFHPEDDENALFVCMPMRV